MSSEESYRAILRYLTNEREPYAPGTEGNVKRKIRKAAACYVVRGGTLYYQRRQRHRKTFAELEVVLQPERRQGLIEAAHLGPGGTHHTRHQTWHDLSKTYWWRGILKQVKDYIKQCSKCQEKLDRSRPISDASEMLEELGLDLESGEESNESEDDLSNFTSPPTTASKTSKKKPVSKHELVFVDTKGVVKRSSPKHCQAVLKQLNEQRLSNQFCDVTLLIEGEEYKAHKSVLSANSEYFRDLFIEKGAVSSHEAVVDLSGFCKASFLPLLEFAYTSVLSFDFCSMADVAVLARHLFMSEVLEICESVHKLMEEKQLTVYKKGEVQTVASTQDLAAHNGAATPPGPRNEATTTLSSDLGHCEIVLLVNGEVPETEQNGEPGQQPAPQVSAEAEASVSPAGCIPNPPTEMGAASLATESNQPELESAVVREDGGVASVPPKISEENVINTSQEDSDIGNDTSPEDTCTKDFSDHSQSSGQPLKDEETLIEATEKTDSGQDDDTYRSRLRQRSVNEGGYIRLHKGMEKKLQKRKAISKSAVQQVAQKLVQRGKKMKQPKRDAKESAEETPHKCGECGMVFPRRYAFIMHTLKHERARDYKCPLCKKQFQYSASLRAHLIRHTRKDAPTSSSSNSTSNEASGASSEKGRTKREFICSICGRTLPKLYSLRIHMLKHTGVKPHACQLHSDMDRGDGSIKYILSGEGAGIVFTIDDTTGDIHAIQRLDREERAQYTLRAQALDRRTGRPMEPESEFIIKIQDINDNEPKFLDGPYVATVPEMSPVGTSVIQVTATDADDPTYGNSARVVYSILQGQPYFSVDSKTGVIRTALMNMDREAKEYYEVIIQAKDMGGQLGGLAGTTTVNITLSDVNDNPPRFPQKHYQMSVLESAPVSSTVGRVFAKDLDEGINAEMKYTIVDGDGADAFDINTDPNFQVGIITVKKPLSFESKKSYTLKVEGSNPHVEMRFLNLGPFQDTTTVHISVEDVDEPPVFEPRFYFVEVPEDVTIGTTIQIISAKDPDMTNNSIRYSIDRGSDPGRFFYVDITTGALMTARPLDREEFSWHNITVLAMEMNNPSQVGSVAVTIKVLDVNDNAPEFPRFYEAFICENAKAGQLIQTVSAVDQDDPHNGQHFYYSLAPEAANNPNFTVRDNQDNTARILTRRSGFRQQEQSVFYLPILIADSGQPVLSSTGTLTIQVCSCSDDGHVMSCSPEAYMLPVSLSRGALIAILACVFVLLVLVLLILSMRRHRKQPYIIDDDENIHENIVRYDDEGGGEEDTEAFDIAAMWNPREAQAGAAPKTRQDMLPEIESLSRYVPQTCAVSSTVHSYVLAKLYEADMDLWAPPFDSLQTYMFEGDGSVAGSLSSLQSATSDSEQSFDFLTDWGPRFRKLAELYGASEGPSPLW